MIACKHLDFEETGLFSKLIIDYVNESPELTPFYGLKPQVSSYQKMILDKNYNNEIRPVLHRTLKNQYEHAGIVLKKTSKVAEHIEKLLQPTTFTVTTGHQLCAFGGPLYFFYKIMSTIKWTTSLKNAYPEYDFVPVFWMATEDHDFEEVNHIYAGEHKITWHKLSNGKPVGHLDLNDFEVFSSEIVNLAETDFSLNQLKLWESFYLTSHNLAEATRKFVHHFFEDKGLVILDADVKELKQYFIPHIKQDILQQKNYPLLTESNTKLRKTHKTQVNGREINFFYINEQGRNLIKKEHLQFTVENTSLSFTEEELTKHIEQYPEAFSPNVVMRPLYQELILPNLSYIGGPGEIAYWLQLKSVFEANQIAFPILTLRHFITLLSHHDWKQLEKLGLSAFDFYQPIIDTERKLVRLHGEGGQMDYAHQMDELFQHYIEVAMKTNNQIGSELIRLKTELKQSLTHISKKLDKQQRDKLVHQRAILTQLKNEYFPANVPQERHYNIIKYAKNRDAKQLLELVYESLHTDLNKVLLVVFD